MVVEAVEDMQAMEEHMVVEVVVALVMEITDVEVLMEEMEETEVGLLHGIQNSKEIMELIHLHGLM